MDMGLSVEEKVTIVRLSFRLVTREEFVLPDIIDSLGDEGGILGAKPFSDTMKRNREEYD